MFANLKVKKNHITIPGFYDDVALPTKEEKKILRKAPYNEQEYKDELGVKELWGEKGFTTYERTGIRPTWEVNGIWGGYTGEGAKTVLPSKAYAKMSARLVPNQSSQKITELLLDYFQSAAVAALFFAPAAAFAVIAAAEKQLSVLELIAALVQLIVPVLLQ